jgi:long-chain acyl-CoA synthetase
MSWPRTLADLIDVTVAVAPDSTALVDHGERLTYAELDVQADAIACWLLGREHGPRSHVAVVTGNQARFVVALLGIWRAGATAVLPNSRLPLPHIADVIRDSDASLVLASAPFAPLAQLVPGVDLRQVDTLPTAARGPAPRQPVPDDVALLPYTSGSTGRPKGVLLAHRGQLHNASAMASTGLLAPHDVSLICGPAFHANALAGSILPTLLSGGTAVILPGFDAGAVGRAVETHRVTRITGVPAMYQMLLDAGSFREHDVSSLQVLLCGSAPVTTSLLGELEAAVPGVVVLEGYGLTEGGPVVTCGPRFGVRKLGSVGPPLPGVEVRIDGGGDDGELLVRGPGVMLGYHRRPDATAERLSADGWLRSGDRLRRDGDGYYTFLGRMDDMMNVGGENLYPIEVESRIRQLSEVAEVVVVPAPHALKGQVPVAYVTARPGRTIDEERVRRHCLDVGPAYAHPRRVVVLDSLPLSPTGKADRTALMRDAADRG